MNGPALPRMQPVLAVTGLAREARIARGEDAIAVSGGSNAGRLRAVLNDMSPDGLSAVLSFGVAGGLDPTLPAGTIVLATRVVTQAGGLDIAERVLMALTARLEPLAERIHVAPVAGVDQPVLTVAAKSSLHAASAASAVDMESHIGALYAARHGLPFGAVRVVCDPADRAVPAFAMHAVRADGTTDVGAVVRDLVRAPGALPSLLRLAVDAEKAFRALGRCRRLLGFGLGFANLG
jgi:adenosylhomocysteine nucleosidase